MSAATNSPTHIGISLAAPWRLLKMVKSASDGVLLDAATWCHSAEIVGGVAVLVGLVVEVALAYLDFSPGSKIGRWGSVSATLLIAIGVFVEILFSSRGSAYESELTRRAKDRLSEAEKVSGRAIERAAVAELETQRIKQSLQWRRLSQEQITALIDELRGESFPLYTAYIKTDLESEYFRDQIDRALVTAGLETHFFCGVEAAVAVSLTVEPRGPNRDKLATALRKAGIPFLDSNSRPLGGMLTLIVGTRPQIVP